MSGIWPLVILSVFMTFVGFAKLRMNGAGKVHVRRTKLYVLMVLVVGCALFLTVIWYQGSTIWSATQNALSDQKISFGAAEAVTDDYRRFNLTSNKDDTFFGIMFDAGSTGSRIHVFKFSSNSPEKGDDYKLIDELFLLTKPGLSSYADNPSKAADSLKEMLEKAKEYVPENRWQTTDLALKATAGLRLLSNKTAQAILDEVTQLFKTYPFKNSINNVAILEGSEEGLFCWFTVNFLNGLLKNLKNSFGILDLGGGSTQITYLPTSVKATKTPPVGYIVNINMFEQTRKIYSHSYLGLGITAARFQVLGGEILSENLQSGTYNSVCLPNSFSGKWNYGDKEHTISATPVNDSISRFDGCYDKVRSVVVKYKIDQPVDLRKKTFYALSYYFDRAVDAKLIDEQEGGQVKVEEFFSAAKKECEIASSDDKFKCMDLCYISSLLFDGFGFQMNSTFVMKKKIKNIEIAWPLGAMFNVYGKFNKT